jgi:hypothetical protein
MIRKIDLKAGEKSVELDMSKCKSKNYSVGYRLWPLHRDYLLNVAATAHVTKAPVRRYQAALCVTWLQCISLRPVSSRGGLPCLLSCRMDDLSRLIKQGSV